jgi:DNA repair exonuclease SbcCD ATPase subunit
MIKRLYLSNCFSHHDQTFSFEKGVTTITGRNESGKSLIPEMVRYCLFGVNARRGTNDDYKKLVTELDFKVNDKLYRVCRAPRKTTLQIQEGDNWTDLATGIDAVNKKIPEILGYKMNVFDVANCVMQGEIEALGRMIPSEREKMVDQTVGLNVIDDLIKWIGDKSKTAKDIAESIERTLSSPIEPPKPDDYQSSKQLQVRYDELKILNNEKNQIVGWLKNERRKPTKPQCNVQETADELEKLVSARNKIVSTERKLKLELEQLPESKFTEDELNERSKHLELYRKWEHKKMHLDKGINKCPKCGHEWHIAVEALKEFEGIEEIEKPNFDEAKLRQWKSDFERAQQRGEIEKELNALFIPEDRSSDYQIRRDYERDFLKYKKDESEYNEYVTEREDKRNRLAELATVEEEYKAVNLSLVSARTYEQALNTFEGLKEAYDKNLGIVNEKKELAEQYQKAKQALQKLRLRVKGYLMPSLNSVSSNLLLEMTNGVRNQIVIDEKFNIKVDGQPLQTLSGSGKAVANLAIRIGLGQVLTNKVFSIFMADEIDASMDNERAEYTAQCMHRLSDNISQIFLVSHKRPEADHYIDLSKKFS